MTRERRLKKEALMSCSCRGHDMGRFKRHDYWRTSSYSHCRRCGMQVVVNTRPTPNGIDIGGEAVALDCGSPSEWERTPDGGHRRRE